LDATISKDNKGVVWVQSGKEFVDNSGLIRITIGYNDKTNTLPTNKTVENEVQYP
jgi:hypothetical protein